MKIKHIHLLILLTLFFSYALYGQDKVRLQAGELNGYISLVNDSILKFKVNKQDKSEFTFKRQEVLGYEFGTLPDTVEYASFYIVDLLNKDTLLKRSIGDELKYQVKDACNENMRYGKIIRIRQQHLILLYTKPFSSKCLQNEILIPDICYIAVRNVGKTALKVLLHADIIGGAIADNFINGYKIINPSDKNLKLVVTH